jgi:SAM-dependent methyltransferase
VVARLLDRWLRHLVTLVPQDPGLVVDVGVGEGYALERILDAARPAVGVEYRFDKLAVATGRLVGLRPVRADAGMLPFPDASADLTLCTEVLEHLPRPEAAVAELARITRGVCLVSVPWEPWFRLGNLARGKNVSALGNDPEHVQQFSRGGLRRLLGQSFEATRISAPVNASRDATAPAAMRDDGAVPASSEP